MHRCATLRLAAAMLTIAFAGFAQPAHPESGNACVDAPAELRRHLAASGASERLDALQGSIENAVDQSGHAPRELVANLFADPQALARASTARPSLLPRAKPLALAGTTALDAALERLDRIHEQVDAALGEITGEQASDLHRLLPALFGDTANGSDLEQRDHGNTLVEIHARIDFAALESAAALLAGLTRPELAHALAEEFRARPVRQTPEWLARHATGGIPYAEQTPHGAVIVGGPGRNIYTGPATLIIDTGGDDIYALPPDGRVRIIIDLAGNDNYVGQAGSVLGASLIVDHAGDDTWSGTNIAQGAAIAGIGMLYDHAGNDRYLAGELAQGAALAGMGVLVDNAGDDLYTAARFAQGFGGALGTGVLSDRAGNDVYIAGNKHPSSYDVAGNYQAFSQGMGMGFRTDIAGGIGLLHDHGGDDQYTAGNFGQGTGYYLGAGVLLDEAGNDTYSGGRYNQGAAAHMGIGLLRDEAGNDTYTAGPSASQGAAWDLALAALIDYAGDDTYTTNEFGLGAAAQNAIAFFIDTAGENEITAQRDARGYEGPTEYHEDGGRIGNLAVFITGKCPGAGTMPPTSKSGVDRGNVPDASSPKIFYSPSSRKRRASRGVIRDLATLVVSPDPARVSRFRIGFAVRDDDACIPVRRSQRRPRRTGNSIASRFTGNISRSRITPRCALRFRDDGCGLRCTRCFRDDGRRLGSRIRRAVFGTTEAPPEHSTAPGRSLA
ncbi:MAG: hypothetical protein WD397_15555 [Wenzhouxiangellaceae bacterium]